MRAKPPGKSSPVRIGALLWHDSPNDLAAWRGMRSAWRTTGRAHVIDTVDAESRTEVAQAALQRWQRERVDLVFAFGTEAALLAKAHAGDRPVVFSAVTHPVGSGVVDAWDGSNGTLAGNSSWVSSATKLSVFRRAVPGLDHLGMLRSTSTGRVSRAEFAAMQGYLAGTPTTAERHRDRGVARTDRTDRPRLRLTDVELDSPARIGAAVDDLAAAGVQAIWVPIDYTIYQRLDAVIAAARRHRLPVLSSSLQGTLAGAVAGVFVDYERLGQRATAIGLKILDGAAPGRLPIEQMAGYQVVVNLVAAKQCDYELPLSLLAVADRLIDPALANSKAAERGR